MLEIIWIHVMTHNIAKIVRDKGRSPVGYVVLFVFLWLGGEIIGAIVGALATAGPSGPSLFVYLFALVGGAAGGTIAYQVAKSVSPLDSPVPLSFLFGQPGQSHQLNAVAPGSGSSQPPVWPAAAIPCGGGESGPDATQPT